jgi:hypothetical protein
MCMVFQIADMPKKNADMPTVLMKTRTTLDKLNDEQNMRFKMSPLHNHYLYSLRFIEDV